MERGAAVGAFATLCGLPKVKKRPTTVWVVYDLSFTKCSGGVLENMFGQLSAIVTSNIGITNKTIVVYYLN